MGWDSMDYSSSPSMEFTSSPSTLSDCIQQAAALPYRPRFRRVEMVMVHDPYTLAGYKQIPRVPPCAEYTGCIADVAHLETSDTQSQSDCECDCDGVGECDVDLEAVGTVEGEASQKKRIRKKKVKCPNGHRAAKRLRYRKGQSHYSCLECLIRWKA